MIQIRGGLCLPWSKSIIRTQQLGILGAWLWCHFLLYFSWPRFLLKTILVGGWAELGLLTSGQWSRACQYKYFIKELITMSMSCWWGFWLKLGSGGEKRRKGTTIFQKYEGITCDSKQNYKLVISNFRWKVSLTNFSDSTLMKFGGVQISIACSCSPEASREN